MPSKRPQIGPVGPAGPTGLASTGPAGTEGPTTDWKTQEAMDAWSYLIRTFRYSLPQALGSAEAAASRFQRAVR